MKAQKNKCVSLLTMMFTAKTLHPAEEFLSVPVAQVNFIESAAAEQQSVSQPEFFKSNPKSCGVGLSLHE